MAPWKEENDYRKKKEKKKKDNDRSKHLGTRQDDEKCRIIQDDYQVVQAGCLSHLREGYCLMW